MASTQDTAESALWSAIEALAKKSEAASGTVKAQMVRDAAVAYRAVLGGPQPGSIIVETK